MKIAITAQKGTLSAKIDPRFGRAKFFIVINTENNEMEVVDNSVNLNAAQGAGIQSGQNVAALGVECVITGHVGPKAFSVLQAAGVKVYTTSECIVDEAVELFKKGALKSTDNADVEGHWA